MKVRAIHLRFKSPLSVLPTAPLLWGHLAWWVRYTQGEEALQGFLESFRTNPPFRLSSAFPKGFLPRPLRPAPQVQDTTQRKALKSLRYLPLGDFAQVAEQGEGILLEKAQQGILPKAPRLKPETRTRVGINRTTGTAQEGILFNEQVYWSETQWTVYVQGEGGLDLLQALGEIGQMGFGGRASVGLGRFTVQSEELTLPEASNPDAWVTLSPCLPARGYYQLEAYWGRLGGHFAQAGNPFKRPYMRAVEGSVFFEKPQEMLLDVTPAQAPEAGVRVYEYLYPFLLGVRVVRPEGDRPLGVRV